MGFFGYDWRKAKDPVALVRVAQRYLQLAGDTEKSAKYKSEALVDVYFSVVTAIGNKKIELLQRGTIRRIPRDDITQADRVMEYNAKEFMVDGKYYELPLELRKRIAKLSPIWKRIEKLSESRWETAYAIRSERKSIEHTKNQIQRSQEELRKLTQNRLKRTKAGKRRLARV